MGGSGRAPAPIAADVRRQRQDADDAHERRSGSADADAAGRGVLPGAEAAESPDGAGPVQQRMARHDLHAVELPADAVVPSLLVRQVQTVGGRDDHD